MAMAMALATATTMAIITKPNTLQFLVYNPYSIPCTIYSNLYALKFVLYTLSYMVYTKDYIVYTHGCGYGLQYIF